MAPPNKHKSACPDCFKTDQDDRLGCVRRDQGMCPKPIHFKDDRMVEIVCEAPCGGPNGKHLACPLGNIMKRRQLTNLGHCAYDTCRARVVTTPGRPQAPVLPPIADDASAGK